MAFGDVDGDGDLDVAVGVNGVPEDQGLPRAANRLLLNDGLGGFSDASDRLPLVTAEIECIGFADIDRDGDLDLVAGSLSRLSPSCSRLFLDDGSGHFSDHSLNLKHGYQLSAFSYQLRTERVGWNRANAPKMRRYAPGATRTNVPSARASDFPHPMRSGADC